jgi:uncharacterized protein (TIGR02646 family)
VIRIKRGRPPADLKVYLASVPGTSLAMVSPADLESERASVFFTDPKNYAGNRKLTRESFAFRVYKDADLAAALEQVFGPKCAYCESRFAHVTPKDIEHFRPKSEIDTGAETLAPGYYWLASDWDNLLVSCPDCNRGRRFEVPGQPKKIRLGKSTQFPLTREAGRIRSAVARLGSEEALRLLIDPCKDQPERHLTFDADGLVHPRLDHAGRPSRKGAISIPVYALQRKALVEERRVTLNSLRTTVEELRLAIQTRNGLVARGITGELMETNAESIRLIKLRLRELLRPEAPYLGMLRGWIRSRKAAGDFADLERCGIDLEVLL